MDAEALIADNQIADAEYAYFFICLLHNYLS
jgi:hypothetical protein